jgi:hypothetical protein
MTVSMVARIAEDLEMPEPARRDEARAGPQIGELGAFAVEHLSVAGVVEHEQRCAQARREDPRLHVREPHLQPELGVPHQQLQTRGETPRPSRKRCQKPSSSTGGATKAARAASRPRARE